MKPNTVSPTNIRILRLVNYTKFILTKNGFKPHGLPDGSTIFRRPNSYWATKMEANDDRVILRKDCNCPIMIGGTFVEEFLRTGLFTLGFDESECVITSINPPASATYRVSEPNSN